jgi:hypothetical protein
MNISLPVEQMISLFIVGIAFGVVGLAAGDYFEAILQEIEADHFFSLSYHARWFAMQCIRLALFVLVFIFILHPLSTNSKTMDRICFVSFCVGFALIQVLTFPFAFYRYYQVRQEKKQC